MLEAAAEVRQLEQQKGQEEAVLEVTPKPSEFKAPQINLDDIDKYVISSPKNQEDS